MCNLRQVRWLLPFDKKNKGGCYQKTQYTMVGSFNSFFFFGGGMMSLFFFAMGMMSVRLKLEDKIVLSVLFTNLCLFLWFNIAS